MNTLVIDGIAFSRKLPRKKKCAVTSNYCMTSWYLQVKVSAASLQLAIGSTRGPDYNSLRSALREVQDPTLSYKINSFQTLLVTVPFEQSIFIV